MKRRRKLLNDSSGFTLIELVLVILVFAIMIVPIYKMLISGAKIQKTSEETYEATLQAQSVLQSVKGQIEKDVMHEKKVNRGLEDPTVKPVAKWLTEAPTGANDRYLFNFLNGVDLTTTVDSGDTDVKKLRKTFKTDTFLYEVHIWPMASGGVGPIPVSMIEYDPAVVPIVAPPDFTITGETPADFTMVEIDAAATEYFEHYGDSLLWTKPADIAAPTEEELKAVGVITYNADEIAIAGGGMKAKTPSTVISPIAGYEGVNAPDQLAKKISLDYTLYASAPEDTYEFVISNESNMVADQLTGDDFIYLTVDLATFPYTTLDPVDYVKENDNRVIRIENKTAATVVVPVYNEKDLGIKIFPIQHQTEGNIIVEGRDKREPGKNFVIGVIVRDAFNSTFGKPNKILSKIVDVYSYDYNKE